jgi:glycosyltransferase involved in cell wall biosynthesis
VSVIIPTYGKVEYTLCCLASIAAYPPEASIEVIVVDDAIQDGSTSCLAAVQGIRLIVNPSNLGYLRSCNTAARVANGEFLLLLNNDTQVMPGWLDALLTPFRCRAAVGAVGSKLLYPDGRLQEAGCIVWDDGSGWNFGRLDCPDRPVYNYLREWITVPPPRCWCRVPCSARWAASTNATRRLTARTATLPSGCASAATRCSISRARRSCISRVSVTAAR